jgi:hypothetical protein
MFLELSDVEDWVNLIVIGQKKFVSNNTNLLHDFEWAIVSGMELEAVVET